MITTELVSLNNWRISLFTILHDKTFKYVIIIKSLPFEYSFFVIRQTLYLSTLSSGSLLILNIHLLPMDFTPSGNGTNSQTFIPFGNRQVPKLYCLA